MEKRALIAIALSVLVYLTWMTLFPPPPPQPPSAPAETVETAGETTDARTDVAEPAEDAVGEPAALDEAAIAADAEAVTVVENGPLRVELTNRGAGARSWTLLDFTTPQGDRLQLFPRFTDGSVDALQFELDDPELTEALNRALFQATREPLPATDGGPAGERVTFRWADGRGLEAVKRFEFRDGSYLVDVAAEVLDRGRRKPVRLTMGPGFAAQEPESSHSNYYYRGQAVWNVSGQVTRTKQGKLGEDGGTRGRVIWAGLEDQYFAGLIVPLDPDSELRWRTVQLTREAHPLDPEDDQPDAGPKTVLSISVGESGARVFIGPKKYTLLRSIGFDLDQVVWFSSYGWLRPIVKALFSGLLWLHDHVTTNYGLAILLATFILRLVLFPVNQYSMVNMKKSQLQMQKLQPKVKAIRNKYRKAKDAQSRGKMNEEMMALYKKEGVNPMGGLTGCLPLLAQFPILIGFYNMLTVAVELRGAPFFGWIQDLSQEDPYYITPIVMAVTMFAQQKLAMSRIKDPQQLQQQRIMLFMPVMFGFICLQMPSGLVLYWLMNNLLGIFQQWLVNRHTSRLEIAHGKA